MERGSWDDPRARATRGLRRPSLDARSWDHPSHPLVKGGKGSLAAALLNGLFEHPAGAHACCVIHANYRSLSLPILFFRAR